MNCSLAVSYTHLDVYKRQLLDEIVFSVYSDENAVILALQNGEIDTSSNFITVAAQNQLQNNASFELLSVQSLGYGFISFCQNNTLLQDANLRKAMAMALSLIHISRRSDHLVLGHDPEEGLDQQCGDQQPEPLVVVADPKPVHRHFRRLLQHAGHGDQRYLKPEGQRLSP